MSKVKGVLVALCLFVLFNGLIYGCAKVGANSSGTYITQETTYDYCIRGVPPENAQHWKRECLLKSAGDLPAPLLSAWFPITYEMQYPTLGDVFTYSLETEKAVVSRRLVADVQQTFPAGKRISFFARLHTIEIDAVCVFFDNEGKIESMAENCHTPSHRRWYTRQAGFDGRMATQVKAASIAREISHDLPIGTSYDWLASFFYKPQ